MENERAVLGPLIGHGRLVVEGGKTRSVHGSFEALEGGTVALLELMDGSVPFEGVIYAAGEPRRGACRVQVVGIVGSVADLVGSGAPTFTDRPSPQ